MIPTIPRLPLRWALGGVLVLSILLGWKYVTWRLDSQAATISTQASEIGRLKAKLAFEYITRQVYTEYVEVERVVYQKGQTIIKEIPVYVTPEADAACVVPVGFVSVHDAAVQNSPLPGTPGLHESADSGVALSEVAGVVTDNYTTCHVIRERLIATENWIRRVREEHTVD